MSLSFILKWLVLCPFYRYIKANFSVYTRFIQSDEFSKLSLLGHVDYQVPFYLVSGDKDYQANYLIAQDYFNTVKSPRKRSKS